MLIKSINWIITDVCNLRCQHCDIWRLPKNMIDNDFAAKLLSDPVVEKSYGHYGSAFDISLGGGEPFAHPHLQDIVTRINQKYPGALKSLSTNGVLTKRIFCFLRSNPELDVKLNISVDGLEHTHDKIRGMSGAFNKTMQTIRIIKRLFPGQKMELKMTIMRDNYLEINEVHRLARKLGCSFSCKPVDLMENYTNRNMGLSVSFSEEEICAIRNQAFCVADAMLRDKEYKKARFTKDIPFHMAGKRRHASCSVLWEHITVMANGDIYFCIKEEKAGNIFKSGLSEMETKPKDFKCKSCMLMCGSFKDYEDTPHTETVANFEATLRCNLTCAMCTQKELQTPGTTMSLDRFASLTRQYHFDHVSFIGGESFINPAIFDMMALLDARGITYELTTNGTLFTECNKTALQKCAGLKKINFSIDGMEKYHDRVRGKSVFKKAMKALTYAKKYFNVSVASIIKSDNLSMLPNLRRYLNACAVPAQKFIYAMDLSGSAIQGSLAKIPELNIQGPQCARQVKDPAELKRLFAELETLSPNCSFEPGIMRAETEEFLKDEPIGQCKQLRQLRFSPDGERIVCEFIRNAYTSDLRDRVEKERLPICTHCCKMDFPERAPRHFFQERGAREDKQKKIYRNWARLKVNLPPEGIMVQIPLNIDCNANCIMCDKRRFDLSSGFSYDSVLEIIDWLDNKTVSSIKLLGGEPLLDREGLVRLVEKCTQKAIGVIIHTNASLFDEKYAEALINAGLTEINLSIDAYGKQHDAIRGIPGLFERIEKTVMYLRKRHPDFILKVEAVVMKENLSGIADLIVWADEKGVTVFTLKELEDYGRNYDRLKVSDPERRALDVRLARLKTTLRVQYSAKRCPQKQCHYLFEKININSQKKIIPCQKSLLNPFTLDRPLKELYQEKLFNEYVLHLAQTCLRCKYDH